MEIKEKFRSITTLNVEQKFQILLKDIPKDVVATWNRYVDTKRWEALNLIPLFFALRHNINAAQVAYTQSYLEAYAKHAKETTEIPANAAIEANKWQPSAAYNVVYYQNIDTFCLWLTAKHKFRLNDRDKLLRCVGKDYPKNESPIIFLDFLQEQFLAADELIKLHNASVAAPETELLVLSEQEKCDMIRDLYIKRNNNETIHNKSPLNANIVREVGKLRFFKVADFKTGLEAVLNKIIPQHQEKVLRYVFNHSTKEERSLFFTRTKAAKFDNSESKTRKRGRKKDWSESSSSAPKKKKRKTRSNDSRKRYAACTFGKDCHFNTSDPRVCHNWHPNVESQRCRFGAKCKDILNCNWKHSPQEVDNFKNKTAQTRKYSTPRNNSQPQALPFQKYRRYDASKNVANKQVAKELNDHQKARNAGARNNGLFSMDEVSGNVLTNDIEIESLHTTADELQNDFNAQHLRAQELALENEALTKQLNILQTGRNPQRPRKGTRKKKKVRFKTGK